MPVDEKPQVVNNQPASGGAEPPRLPRPIVVVPVVVIAFIVGFFIYSGIRTRTAAAKTLARDTREMAIPAVNVISPQMGAPAQEITLPGNTQAFTDTPDLCPHQRLYQSVVCRYRSPCQSRPTPRDNRDSRN